MADLYLLAAELQAALPTSGNDDFTLLNIAIAGASRGIDAHCGQRFGTDTVASVRHYYPSGQLCQVDPISDVTGLEVKTDTDSTGTYSTTLTINTDFILLPVNALDSIPVRPYTQIWLPDQTFPTTMNGRPTVQVTAVFGWPSVPDDVHAAALLLSRDLFKELKDAPFGVAGVAEFGVLRIRQNPTARALLARYVKPRVA